MLDKLKGSGVQDRTVPNINFEVDDDQYERLKETKKRHGLTWKGMMLHAQRELDSEGGD